MEFRDIYGRIGGRIATPKERRNPQEDNRIEYPGSLRLSETEPLTKEHTWAGSRPLCMYEADVLLGHHVGPEQLDWGLSQS